MLYSRHRLLLTLLDSLGGESANTDYQKLLFLYTRECEEEPSYDFVPYHYGGFSFTSYADKRRLTERGLLANDDNRWRLSASGRTVAREMPKLRERTRSFVRRLDARQGDKLIAHVYRRYPYYAIHSSITGRVLPDKRDRDAIKRARPVAKGRGLVTIGYEGKSLESYLNQLIQDSVTVLCDVRRNPLSRKYGFSRSTLKNACENVGIRYEHISELGIPSENRRELNSQEKYDALFARYKRNNLPKQKEAISRIRKWIMDGGERVALTCYEALPGQCHRHCVAEALERFGDPELIPVHL